VVTVVVDAAVASEEAVVKVAVDVATVKVAVVANAVPPVRHPLPPNDQFVISRRPKFEGANDSESSLPVA